MVMSCYVILLLKRDPFRAEKAGEAEAIGPEAPCSGMGWNIPRVPRVLGSFINPILGYCGIKLVSICQSNFGVIWR